MTIKGLYHCSFDELVSVHKLVPHPQNPNKHPENQIERLSKIIDYQGQRSPIVVCKSTGFIIVGHGRLQAIKKLGWDEVAVNYQTFTDDAQRYAHMVADNAVSDWAALDLDDIKDSLEDLDVELDLLGIEKFEIEKLKLEKEPDIDINFDYKIEVNCNDEEQQKYLTEELEDRGFKVRILL